MFCFEIVQVVFFTLRVIYLPVVPKESKQMIVTNSFYH